MHFAKYEGIGNDFIVVDDPSVAIDADRARTLCDRHRGIGGDGVLVTGVRNGRPFMTVYNADGSRPEMCGNGIRCVALHLVRKGKAGAEPFVIETDAGPHRCRVLSGGTSGRVEVAMRAASLSPEAIPVRADRPLVDAPFELGGEALRLTAVSMGNPHAVLFDVPRERRVVLGPMLETDPRFPERVNAGFARMEASGVLELAVWERGVGWTEACGTGACAAAVAAVETGRATRDRPIPVRLPGGTLEIVVPLTGQPVLMTGPARHVFDGRLAVDT